MTTGSGGAGGGFEFEFGDLLGNAGGGGGGLGDLFGGIFGGRRAAAPRRGADIESDVTMSFGESLEGVTVPLRLATEAACSACGGTGAKAGTTPHVCPTCQGTGNTSRNQGGFAFAEPCRTCRGRGLVVDDPCPVCHGSGRGQSSRTVQARIPAGVKDGARIRLKGKGAPGERGGPNGDLMLTVHVTAHPVFGRKGENVTLTVPVTFPEAALGADISVPTPDGAAVTLRVPPGTSNGRTFRVKGKGMRRTDGSMGDLLVKVEVAVPQKLDSAAREALEAFRDVTKDHDPRDGLAESARTK